MKNFEEDPRLAYFNHPIDELERLNEPNDLEREASVNDRRRAGEFLERALLWISDSRTLRDRGLRTTAALWAIRPDLVDSATLEKLAESTDCDPQSLHRMAVDFRNTLSIKD